MAKSSVYKLSFVVIYTLLLTLQSSIKASFLNASRYHVETVHQYSYQIHIEWLCFSGNLSTEAINCCKLLASSPIACLESGPALEVGYCATYDDKSKVLSIAECQLFHQSYNITDPEGRYLPLPTSLSDLNDYVCGSLNRKGIVCSECVDGFGPSVTSLGNVCTHCTGTWYYRLTLFLLIELVPITIFYLLVLAFEVSVTTPPMPCFIMYSQLIIVAFASNGYNSLKDVFTNDADTKWDIKIFHTFYSIFNLEIFRYLFPHFCLTSKLKFIHLAFLGYISAFYPIALIILTWILVELHGRNVRALVWIWRPFHRCFVCVRRGWDTKSDMIDVFITFFLLSYTKCSYQTLQLLNNQKIFYYDLINHGDAMIYSVRSSVDLSITYLGPTQVLFAVPAMLIFFVVNILLPLLLILYPMKCFRFCLSKCCINMVAVNIFVNKLQSYYKSHMDGGWDMRSFSALYFYLRIGIYLVAAVFTLLLKEKHVWFSTGLVSLSIAFIIVSIRPYKMKYMNIVDALLLINYALVCFAMAMSTIIRHSFIKLLIKTPAMIFIFIILVRTLWRASKFCFHKKKLKALVLKCWKCCRIRGFLFHNNYSTEIQAESEQPLIQPTSTEIVID